MSQFSPTPTTPIPDFQPLVALLRALASNVSHISLNLHRSLITAILGLPWAIGDDRFVKSYIGWTGVLVSAHPECAQEVLTKLIKGLTWRMLYSPMHCTDCRTLHPVTTAFAPSSPSRLCSPPPPAFSPLELDPHSAHHSATSSSQVLPSQARARGGADGLAS